MMSINDTSRHLRNHRKISVVSVGDKVIGTANSRKCYILAKG